MKFASHKNLSFTPYPRYAETEDQLAGQSDSAGDGNESPLRIRKPSMTFEITPAAPILVTLWLRR